LHYAGMDKKMRRRRERGREAAKAVQEERP